MSIEKIVENINNMQELFKEYGFDNVRLFKGFGALDEKNFYLTAAFQTGGDWFADINKKKQLEEKLKNLLGCYVNMVFEDEMDKDYLKYVNEPGGCVNLSEVIEKTVLQKKLESYFGQGWQFNAINPYEQEKVKELLVEEEYAFPITNLTPSIFAKPAPELSITSIQKIEERVNELDSKLAGFTNDEFRALRVRLLQFIDQKLSASQAAKK